MRAARFRTDPLSFSRNSIAGRKRDALATQKTRRNVNREGQRWTEDRAGMTLRLPIDLREAVTEEARVAGDLSSGSFRSPSC